MPCLRCRWRRLRLTRTSPISLPAAAPGPEGRLSPLFRREPLARVLLIAPPSSYRVAAYLQAAEDLGIRVVVASQGEHSLVPEIAEGLHVDFGSPSALGALIAQGREAPIDAVLATDDRTVELASRVAHALGLRHNSVESARISRRKDLAREALARAGLAGPSFRRVDLTIPMAPQLRGVSYPCVVKPLASSGSRGVIRADDEAQLLAACDRVRPLLEDATDREERRHLLVEDFIPGFEVALEGMLDDGDLQVLALFDKPDSMNGPFFEETYYITPSRLSGQVQATIQERVQQACQAYGLREGPVHAELRVSDRDVHVLEVAARTIGGQCARLLGLGTGRSLESLVLAHAAGRRTDLATSADALGVLMIPIPRAGILRRVEGVLAAREVPHVVDVEISIREGYELVPLPEGSSYLGFIFSRAPTPHLAEQALRQAHACLNIVTAPVWKLMPGS